ncbi:hypothetical protein [Natronorubrum halophilum]|uniref:hypothetical protein n=1 Tax=Natronorubrum halophilum TaxID=1702106 RepID=UPI000EF6D72E|nr:hypothetical protein [Natronorubrum halophilum]
MVDERSRSLEYGTQLLVFVGVLLATLAVLALLVALQADPAVPLEAIPLRVSPGLLVVGALLVAGAIGIPALILTGWQATQKEATRDRER